VRKYVLFEEYSTEYDPVRLSFARYGSEGNSGHLERGEAMQAGQLSKPNLDVRQVSVSAVTERLNGWIARVFGCWHTDMSRPFSHEGQAYRVCLKCGAQRRFNLGNWKMQGEFYYQRATTSQFYSMNRLAAVRRTVS
jgi:hypothetical protein